MRVLQATTKGPKTGSVGARALTGAALTVWLIGSGIGPAHAAPTCYGSPVTIIGDAGPKHAQRTPNVDVIHGVGGDDTIQGFGGNDVVCGGAGTDAIRGGDGDDLLFGGEFFTGNGDGIDHLYGGNGNDSLFGGDGGDWLHGEDGEDVLYGNLGDDQLLGGPGVNDTASFQYDPQGVIADLVTGKASGQGSDSLSGVERLVGSASNDRLYGDAGANTFIGLQGNDLFDGAARACASPVSRAASEQKHGRTTL